jgi:multidrug resistance protein
VGGIIYASEPQPRRSYRRPVLIALMTSMALAAMDTTIVSTAIPQVVRDLGGFSLFSWVFSSYLLTQTVTIPVQGRLADQWGRKPVLIMGTIIFLAGSALCASSTTMASLILFRGIQGIGAGGVQATVNTLAGDLYALSERGRVQGWLSSVWGISAVIGPALGGSLAQYASWRWIFLINLPVGAAAIGLLVRYLHENVQRTRHRIDVAGGAAMFAATGTLIFGLVQGGVAWPWWSLPSGLVFAAALAAAGLAVVAERRAAEPIMPPWFWRSRSSPGRPWPPSASASWSSARPHSCPPTASPCSAWGAAW